MDLIKFEKIATKNRVILEDFCLELRDTRISRYWTNIRTMQSYIRLYICIWHESNNKNLQRKINNEVL